jgi:methanogenic corrinoid protein MtbC1
VRAVTQASLRPSARRGGPPTPRAVDDNQSSGQPPAAPDAATPRMPAPSAARKSSPKGQTQTTRWGRLAGMGSQHPGDRSKPSRRRVRDAAQWAPWALIILVAAAGAILLEPTVLVAVCLVAIAAVAGLVGWRVGDGRRRTLQRQIDDRETELRRALTELEIAQAETVRRLSMAVEFRDEDTGAHIERIGRFSTLLAEQVGMEIDFCGRLSHAAPLHDVGKVAIPDAILLKPGALSQEERAIVETHAEEGHRLLRGSSSSILDLAATIALSHHEKWDGTGYPRGLKGEEIPMEGRIVAIADVFDALTSDRVYRGAFSVEKATEMMREQRGLHFDPVLLDAFLEVLGNSGPDARAQIRSDPASLVDNALEAFFGAIERGDAEAAEGAIASAIDDGLTPGTMYAEVIAPALGRIGDLREAGEVDLETQRLAAGITRRILATMFRYMLSSAASDRERVLVAGVEGEAHSLGLQMVHDQLAAAGYQTTLETELSLGQLAETIDSHSPDLVVVGLASGAPHDGLLRKLQESYPSVPILLGSAAAGAAVGEPTGNRPGVRELGRIDQSVAAVEELLVERQHAVG